MCPTKQSLIDKYDVAARAYSDAVTKMHRAATLSLEEFGLFYDAAKAAHDLCHGVHDALRSHVEEHGC
jgi:hypothetical protein